MGVLINCLHPGRNETTCGSNVQLGSQGHEHTSAVSDVTDVDDVGRYVLGCRVDILLGTIRR